jgi:hypothetical protein
MSYQGVMRLASEHPLNTTMWGTNLDWIIVVKGCYEEAKRVGGGKFAGAWVINKVGWFPGLRILETYGILKKEGETVRGGRRAYWSMPDIEGVKIALLELGYI